MWAYDATRGMEKGTVFLGNVKGSPVTTPIFEERNGESILVGEKDEFKVVYEAVFVVEGEPQVMELLTFYGVDTASLSEQSIDHYANVYPADTPLGP